MDSQSNAEETLKRIRALVAEQAQDEGLWFIPVYASEDYLQKALRRLHAIIEDDEIDKFL